MNYYKHIFFDLDHTLWDFEKNSNEALQEIFENFELSSLGEQVILDDFLKIYHQINHHLWQLYNRGEIDQMELRYSRFQKTLEQLDVKPEIIPNEALAEEYLRLTPRKPHLVPFAIEVLEYLKEKQYNLHIITNGFAEIQDIKLNASKISSYFDLIVTSSNANCKKPEKAIFDYAIQNSNAIKEECIMIGDNIETDIQGANNAGIDVIFYNPEKVSHNETITFEIISLRDLFEIL